MYILIVLTDNGMASIKFTFPGWIDKQVIQSCSR